MFRSNQSSYVTSPGEIKTTPWLCIPGCIWVKGQDDKAQGNCLITGISVNEIKEFISQRIHANATRKM